MSWSNPVYDGYFADPFVWEHQGVYWAVGTGEQEGDGTVSTPLVIPLLRSEDLIHWDYVGKALEATPATAGGSYWAPEVAYQGGKFYLYFAAGKGGHHMRVAVSDKPQGPYRDLGKVLFKGGDRPFAIDGHAFRDDDGAWYYFSAMDFLDTAGGARVGTSIVGHKMASLDELQGKPVTLLRAHHDWQLYQHKFQKHGGVWDWHTIEGPFVRKRLGKYWCMYSGGCFLNESYGVDWLEGDSPLGPYRDTGNGKGARLTHSIPGKVIGPGHHSVVTDPKTGQDYIVYHAWNKEMTRRQMWIDPLHWDPKGPWVERFGKGWE
jgi:GH43 family beta-xylosidase